MEKKINVFILSDSLVDNIVAYRLHKSAFVENIYCLENNSFIKEYCNPVAMEMTNYAALAKFVQQNSIDYVFTASYKALLSKTVDYLRGQGIHVIAYKDPSQDLFRNSMDYRKLLSSYRLSIPPSRIFDMYGDAINYVEDSTFPLAAKTNDPGLSLTSLCQTVEEAQEFLSFTMKSIRYREEETDVLFEKYIKGQNMVISGIVDQKEILLFPDAHCVKSFGEPSIKSLWLPSEHTKKNLHKNWESTVLVPTLHAIYSHLQSYRGPLLIDVIFDQKNPYIVDLRTEWDALYLQAMLHSMESDIFSVFRDLYQGSPLDSIDIKWNGGILGFLLPLTMETGLYMNAFAQNLKKISAAERDCSIQITEGIKEFPGSSLDRIACLTIKAPSCSKAKEFFLSQWRSARLPEDFPILQNIDVLVLKDW